MRMALAALSDPSACHSALVETAPRLLHKASGHLDQLWGFARTTLQLLCTLALPARVQLRLTRSRAMQRVREKVRQHKDRQYHYVHEMRLAMHRGDRDLSRMLEQRVGSLESQSGPL